MKNLVGILATLARRAPLAVVIATLVISGFLGYFAGRVEIATGNEGFSPDNAEIEAQQRIADLFGSDSGESVVQIIVRNEGGNVITADGLRATQAVVEAVRSSEAGPYLADRPDRPPMIHYLSTVEQAAAASGTAPGDLTDDQIAEIFAEPLDGDGDGDAPPDQVGFLNSLLSADADARSARAQGGLILVFLNPPEGATAEESFNLQTDIEVDLAEAVAEVGGEVELRTFSFAILFSGFDEFTQEVGRLFGMAALIIVAILVFVYWLWPGDGSSRRAAVRRTLADTGLTMATILLAIGSMQGLGYLLESVGIIDGFSEPTQIVPILLIGLGVDYAIHMTSRYREEIGRGATVDDAMGVAARTVGVALGLATVTTTIGFLTNIFNPIPALKDFGILAGVGIVVAFALMLTFVPAFRMLLDRKAERRGTLSVASLGSHGDRVLPRLVEKASVLAERVPVATLVVTLALGVLGWYGFSQLETRFSFTDFLPEGSPAVETLEILADEFGGGFGEQTAVLIESGDGSGIDAAVHNAMVDANNALAAVPDVAGFETDLGRVATATSPISLLASALAGGGEGAPSGLTEAAERAMLGDDLKVDPGADIASLYQALVATRPEAERVVSIDSGQVDAVLFDIQTTAGEARASSLRANLGETFSVVGAAGGTTVATSDNIIADVIIQELTASQSRSLLITLLVAGLVLVISFWFENRRPFLGVITIAPVALVVLWTYGLMFVSGIPFGPVTATLSALAIGIGVPFTIHIARRFEEDRNRYRDLDSALRSTARHTGGALAGSAFTTMAGFGILITSSLIPFRQLGQVTVYAIGLSLIAAVFVLPSMLALWERYHRRSRAA